MINSGYHASIIAINDRRIKQKTWQGKQTETNTKVDVLRIANSVSWKQKLEYAKQFADQFNPDWISLQFVPFGYQIKGLPFKLDNKIKALSKQARKHVMFHELSVNKNESFKFRIWAFLQFFLIKSLLKGLKPSLITTNTQVYQFTLKKLGYNSQVLPLFSNIPKIHFNNREQFENQVPDYLYNYRNDFLTGTLFGNFSHKSWNLHSLLKKLQQHQTKKIVIASIGKMSSGEDYWQTLKAEYPSITFLTLGIRDAEFISYWLTYFTDFGILTTLPELSGKSGSFMAFKEHGIPVFCKEPDGQLSQYKIELDACLTVVADNDEPLIIPKKSQPVSLVETTVKNFIALLK